MDTHKVKNMLQMMIARCGQTIRDCERRATHCPDQPPIDVEWFRAMLSKAEACLKALDAGDDATFRAMIDQIAKANDEPLWNAIAGGFDLLATQDGLPTASGQGDSEVSCRPAKVVVNRIDMREGWVCFMAAEPPPKPDDLPLYLSQTVTAWLKQNPMLTVRAVLPIVSGGNTIAIHVWFD